MLRILLVTQVPASRHAGCARKVPSRNLPTGRERQPDALRRSKGNGPGPGSLEGRAYLIGIECWEEPLMTGLSAVASDERTARMVLSMLVEPNDPVTGRLLARVGAAEVLRLAERDGEVGGLNSVDAQVWRDHFSTSEARNVTERLDQIQQLGVRALIPGDAHWPVALDELGEATPYVLWVRGASSFLARPFDRLRDDHRGTGVQFVRRSCGSRARCLRRR